MSSEVATEGNQQYHQIYSKVHHHVVCWNQWKDNCLTLHSSTDAISVVSELGTDLVVRVKNEVRFKTREDMMFYKIKFSA